VFIQLVLRIFPSHPDTFLSTEGRKMMSENLKPEWSPNIEGDVETKVAKVAKVAKRKNLYRVMGLSAPLLAAGVILAFAQPPSSSPSAPSTQINSALSTKIQSTVAPADSIQHSTPVTSKSSKTIKSAKVQKPTFIATTATQNAHFSTNLTIKKPTISGSAGVNDGNNDGESD